MMTDTEIIKAVAELDGRLDVKEYTFLYDRCGEPGEYKRWQSRSPTNLGLLKPLKPYLTSRDAIVPVIEKQLPSTLVYFGMHLLSIVDKYWESQGKQIDWTENSLIAVAVIQATPYQLCEALLHATGKWKD